ncbi:HNH endonuclease signature motif containing protein [Pseudomonas lini]|uniref:HNH endonuclease n=1 Tax=Pseudomonas lini TaxID=163011 RepID=A0A423IER1_9PSED|nr:HNH endonuclease signature motif containing protein [Pseudomonas lini]RON23930.1 HNH endonuclease [Pseudomonas lini]
MDIDTKNTDWSDSELEAAVDAYLKMLELEQNGQKFNKAQENRLLRQGKLAERTEGSVEFRMLNISTVLERMGRKRINGYKSAPHVGSNVENSIRSVLADRGILAFDEFTPTADEETLERRASALQKQKIKISPKGILNPKRAPTSGTAYVRDPEVRAWVRNEANGLCEGCGEAAPFQKHGLPYLEVHHVKHLAQRGSDRITNAVALCPNCHQRCHHSNDRDSYTLLLYTKVGRLIRE